MKLVAQTIESFHRWYVRYKLYLGFLGLLQNRTVLSCVLIHIHGLYRILEA